MLSLRCLEATRRLSASGQPKVDESLEFSALLAAGASEEHFARYSIGRLRYRKRRSGEVARPPAALYATALGT